MDKIQEKFVNDLTKKGVSPNTVKNYKSQFNSLLELFNFPDNLNFLTTPDKNIKLIDETYTNLNTKASKINIIMVIIRNFYSGDKKWEDIYKIYEVYRDKIKNEIQAQYATGEATDKQKQKVLSSEEKQEIEKQLKEQIPRTIKESYQLVKLRNYIIYKTLNYLLTRLDIGDAKFAIYKKTIKYDINYNWVLINKKDKKVFYYQNKFKTQETEGRNEYQLAPEMYKYYIKYYNALVKLKPVRADDGNIYFLYNEDLENKITLATLSKVFIKLGINTINKPLSIHILRTEIASEDTPALEKIKSKAKKMNHNPKTHITYYMKKDLRD